MKEQQPKEQKSTEEKALREFYKDLEKRISEGNQTCGKFTQQYKEQKNQKITQHSY